MINKELVKYFNKGLNLGHSENVLKKELLNSGWNEVDINDSFNSVSQNTINKIPTIPNFPSSTNSDNSNIKKERPTGVSILAVLIWIGAALGGIQFLTLLGSSIFGVMSSEVGMVGVKIAVSIVYGISIFISYSLGKGMWNGNNGWRVFYLVMLWIGLAFLIIGILFLSSLLGNVGVTSALVFLPSIVISVFLIWYLGYKKNVVEFFHQ